MKVMIATGGTGGHIYPALALAEILEKKEEKHEIVFFGSDNRMEATLIPEKGYRFYGLPMTGMNGGLLAKISSAFSLFIATIQCRSILKKENPDICVGFGNYISIPLMLAAKQLSIPTMIHEANSYAGKANKMLANRMDAIVGCYPSNLDQFPKDKTKILGNPEASLAKLISFEDKDLEEYGLDPNVPFVLVMMGSLGSSSVSKVIDEACALFDSSYQVLVATGMSNDYMFQTKSGNHIHIVEYVDGKKMLKACKLAITRAGATTMAELSALGTPAILIPSPFVPNNHQYYNAMELVQIGSAIMIEEKDLTAQKLADTVNALMKDDTKIKEMYVVDENELDPAEAMIQWMKELVKHGR